MTRIQKKYVFLTLTFLFVSAIIYIIVISYFSNNLNFKEYYTLTNTTKDIQHDKVSYICDNGKIFYVEKEKDNFSIYYVTDEDHEPKKMTSFEIKNVVDYNFLHHEDYLYLFYNNTNNLIIIDKNTYVNQHYIDLPDGQKVYNNYTNEYYVYKEGKINLLLDYDNKNASFDIPTTIKQVKKVDFIEKEKVVISTYNSELFIYDYINNEIDKIDNMYNEYYIADDKVYYTYSTKDRKLGFGVVHNGQEKTFSIESVDYISMRVVDDYIYLINEKNIYKVSIFREKRHETLEISEYIDSTFSLLDVIIINEKLMYLPLIKYENDGVNPFYKYCLYKYEV